MDARTVDAGSASLADPGTDRADGGHLPAATTPAVMRDRPGASAMAPISVVVPCFRCVDTIGEAVASVAAQMLRPREILLVDDCSGDGTLERLHEVAAAYPAGWIKVFSMPRNGGPSGARNRGWNEAGQPYVAFLDADDTWHPLKLKLQMDVLNADPQIALLAHEMNVQTRSAPPPAQRYPLKAKVISPRMVGLRGSLPTASVVLRRDLPFRFDEKRMRAEDFLLWAQILLSGYRGVKINQVLASWHKPPFGAGGLSGDLAAMQAAAADVRKTLHAQGLLSGPHRYLADALSLVRYARRVILTFARRHGGAMRTDRAG